MSISRSSTSEASHSPESKEPEIQKSPSQSEIQSPSLDILKELLQGEKKYIERMKEFQTFHNRFLSDAQRESLPDSIKLAFEALPKTIESGEAFIKMLEENKGEVSLSSFLHTFNSPIFDTHFSNIAQIGLAEPLMNHLLMHNKDYKAAVTQFDTTYSSNPLASDIIESAQRMPRYILLSHAIESEYKKDPKFDETTGKELHEVTTKCKKYCKQVNSELDQSKKMAVVIVIMDMAKNEQIPSEKRAALKALAHEMKQDSPQIAGMRLVMTLNDPSHPINSNKESLSDKAAKGFKKMFYKTGREDTLQAQLFKIASVSFQIPTYNQNVFKKEIEHRYKSETAHLVKLVDTLNKNENRDPDSYGNEAIIQISNLKNALHTKKSPKHTLEKIDKLITELDDRMNSPDCSAEAKKKCEALREQLSTSRNELAGWNDLHKKLPASETPAGKDTDEMKNESSAGMRRKI